MKLLRDHDRPEQKYSASPSRRTTNEKRAAVLELTYRLWASSATSSAGAFGATSPSACPTSGRRASACARAAGKVTAASPAR